MKRTDRGNGRRERTDRVRRLHRVDEDTAGGLREQPQEAGGDGVQHDAISSRSVTERGVGSRCHVSRAPAQHAIRGACMIRTEQLKEIKNSGT